MTAEKITESSSIFQKNIYSQKRLLAHLLANWSSYSNVLQKLDNGGAISYELLTKDK